MKVEIINQIISKIINRNKSLFSNDLNNNKSKISKVLKNKSILVIGGAGTIGFSFIKAILKFPDIKKLYIIDNNENGLAEVIRNIRSSNNLYIPEDIKTYPINFGSNIFKKIFLQKGPFEIVANFAALKHVRSEKDLFSIEAMLKNNFVLNYELLELLNINRPEHFFSVSTDKAANPVSIMGATKKLMEDVILSYKSKFNVTTARFANVAFSNGSLLDSFVYRYNNSQPIVCPSDIKRFFISPKEAGELCLIACLLGDSGDIFFPKLDENKDLINFQKCFEIFMSEMNLQPHYCNNELEAKEKSLKIKEKYPVYIFKTDTSGEKSYEEFFTEDDEIDLRVFKSLGIIKKSKIFNNDIDIILNDLERTINNSVLKKEDIILFLKKYVPNFNHIETGKNLDQKM